MMNFEWMGTPQYKGRFLMIFYLLKLIDSEKAGNGFDGSPIFSGVPPGEVERALPQIVQLGVIL
jgi:hypothetical protein